ncbi:MAG TPA: prepilin-type N-terminal cleavage/methylation domain-containing protein [Luteolibacter sp.]|nr:prepilin-type N-terminal cleavage/methylation domain-containing protein [Luteolibacter sp.]
MKPSTRSQSGGFTLVELLVVITVVAALAATAMAAFRSVRAKANATTELSRMRNLGVAMFSWAAERNGRLPRSSHSATGHGECGWQREILPELGYPDTSRESLAMAKPREFGIDPDDTPVRTPALNVYFELNPEYDDYQGAPQTWRRIDQIPHPSSTVLLVMAKGTADHIMAQYFTSRADDLPAPAKIGKTAAVLWADGSTSLETPGSLFDPAEGIDRFHPEKARR